MADQAGTPEPDLPPEISPDLPPDLQPDLDPDLHADLAVDLPEQLREALTRAQGRGFIGDGDLDPHLQHAIGFARAFAQRIPSPPERALDLGAGGGLPGLVLAAVWPTTQWVLLDASEQRTTFLAETIAALAWDDRVEVARGRAEELAREVRWRGRFDLVVSRSFGPPAVVAECGAGFLVLGGLLVVSEPPGSEGERWDHPDELAQLGLRRVLDADSGTPSDIRADVGSTAGFEVIRQVEACPERFPRRTGIPRKRPLF